MPPFDQWWSIPSNITATQTSFFHDTIKWYSEKNQQEIIFCIGGSGKSLWLLKGRWRCILKRLDNKLNNVSFIIIASCVLHNICEIKDERYIDEGDALDNLTEQERIVKQARVQDTQTC